ncbi:hypothetical protein COK31_11160 [Bacillus cereus]|uniref:GIY-YIG nuclease family protein n=1 Tax=Bacillus cereus TaxID=1396 RepID=UPI000BFA5689|nr:GIY-YIG nuclease family protein [Bacillus cereus]PFR04421.1 hypothetical protein COK31_11160 [Bacillus cereus]
MKKEKSYDVGLKIKGIVEEEYLVLPKIEINEILVKEWKEDNPISSLPSDKHGVYVVYRNNKCLYVGETKNKDGFKGRFQNHHYLKEFKVRATKVILYVIDKEKHNDRVLYEKLKIKELNPILNRVEEREKSINYTLSIIDEVKQNVKELIEIFGEGFNGESQEVEKNVVNNIRQVQEILKQVNPMEYVLGNNQEIIQQENGLTPRLNYNSIKVVDCMMCNGENNCDICNGNGKLIVKSICTDCDGVGYKEGSTNINNKGYCKTCEGTGYSSFTAFEENNHTNFYIESCKVCENTGINVDEEPCEECKGKRFIVVREPNS